MRPRLRQLFSLRAWEVQILLEASLLLPLVALGLRFWGFKGVLRFLMLDTKAAGQDLAQAESIAQLVTKTAAKLPFNSSCLVRALSLARILQNHGLYADLLIGVRKADNAGITAHAWLEFAGQPLAERADIACLYAQVYTSEVHLRHFV